VKEDETGRRCSMNEEKGNKHSLFVRALEGKRLLRRYTHKWKNNVKIVVRGIGWGGMDCTHLTQDRDQWRALVKTIMNLWVTQNIWKFLSS
jgi:hypothetical protein